MAEFLGPSHLHNAPPADLAEGEVHIWRANLDEFVTHLGGSYSTLSPDERGRAERFHFEAHRNRYAAGREFLRLVLSGYLGMDPEQVRFQIGPAGKPSPADGCSCNVQFNLSHSEDQALLVVAKEKQVGADIEHVRALGDATALVEQFFSRREARIFRELQPNQQPRAFFNLWTRKEAFLKATGEGIGHSLHLVEVSFLPEEPARIMAVPNAFGSAADWTLQTVNVGNGLAAAFAVRNKGKPVHVVYANNFLPADKEKEATAT